MLDVTKFLIYETRWEKFHDSGYKNYLYYNFIIYIIYYLYKNYIYIVVDEEDCDDDDGSPLFRPTLVYCTLRK